MSNYPKPILKWVGGKTQIIDLIMNKIPTRINNYREIFVGGGSILFGILKLIQQEAIVVDGEIFAYDLNEGLIGMYNNIKHNPTELYENVKVYIDEYNSCQKLEINRKPENKEEALMNKENYYYWIRQQFNNIEEKTSIEYSAMFIFLNKTNFRGVYREGPNGYNVPYGNYKNPKILELGHLLEIHDLIQNVNFECKGYQESIIECLEDDFLYLDPPYVPEKQTSFVKYNINGFNQENHLELFTMIKERQDIRWLMSNSDVPLIHEHFTEYIIEVIETKRSINSKKPGSKTNEVLIRN